MAAKVQTKIEKVTARAGIFCAESYFRGFQLATSASHARTINLILKSQSYLAAEIRLL
jgi:hypothetical protein